MVIAITNQKGGVGKTSTTTALASCLRREGYKTLVVDSDPQCNSSDTFQAAVDDVYTLHDVITGECTADEAIQHTEHGDIIACDPLIQKADNEFQSAGREYLLKEALEPIVSLYDFIIIDTSPSLGVMLINAMTAADGLVIPILADRYSLQGLDQLNSTIKATIKYTNRNLKILGLLVTMYQDTRLAREVVEFLPSLESLFDTKIFGNSIRLTTKVREATASRLPLFDYDPYCTAARDYENFTKELLERSTTHG